MVLGLDFFFEEFLTFPKTYVKYDFSDAGVAQLVERNLAKVEVASSSLVFRSGFEESKSISYPPLFLYPIIPLDTAGEPDTRHRLQG